MKIKTTKIFFAFNNLAILIIILPIFALLGCSAKSKFDPLNPTESAIAFDAIKPQEWQLPNGMTVLYLPNNELPIVYGSLYLPGGSYWQSTGKLGTISAMGSQLYEGGTLKHTPEQLDAELDKLAAGVSSGFSSEWGKVNFSCLDSDLATVFSIFADVILRPRFDENRLQIWKGNSIESIKRRVEQPATVAQISYLQLLYPDSILGAVSTVEDIERIKRADLIREYNRFVKPGKALLTIGGNITKAEVDELLQKHFGSWKGDPDLPPLEQELKDPAAGVYFIPMPVSQASIMVGHLGVPRLPPDYPEIDLFNEIFGGSGFGLSRLFSRVRTELGLAYSVFGSIRSGVIKGSSIIMVQTKAESAGVAIKESLAVLNGMKTKPVSESELNQVKRAVENSFIFNYDSTSSVLARRAIIKLYGFPDDYDDTYIPKIERVTVDDVQSVAQRRWDPEKFVVVVVGNQAAYDQIVGLVEQKEGPLAGLPLRKVNFDQKLRL